MPVETDQQYVEKVLRNVIRFLRDNEQYGDDWESEIKVLKSLIRWTPTTKKEEERVELSKEEQILYGHTYEDEL